MSRFWFIVLPPALIRLACLSGGIGNSANGAEPIQVKAVVAVTFEVGQDTGDRPGEFQFWVEGEKLDREMPFPAGVHKLRTNADQSVLGIVTGTGPMSSSASIMALGLDPRFDLSKAYWIVSGIAGADPEDASLGSAVWANYVLDGDLVYEVDAREAPKSWPYSRLAIGAKRPNELPTQGPGRDIERLVYELNPKLVDWAYQLTKDVPLMDTPEMAKQRALYKGYPNANKPPFVLKGDDLGSGTYWHGKLMNQWANDWVKLLTGGHGNYVMTDMEDHGMATALRRLAGMKKVDFRRVLFLRTASNYCIQAPGQSVEDSLTSPYVGALPAFDSAYRVGSVVLHQILRQWPAHRDKIPSD